LFIDDLQWGDLDSAPMFSELIAPPLAPAVLVVCAIRSEDEQRSPLLALLRQTHALSPNSLPLLDVRVRPLALPDARRLAMTLLHGKPGAADAAELIARESEGSPFFVRELAEYVIEHGIAAAGRIRLDSLVREKLASLQPDSRALLSLIALAGRPITPATVKLASSQGNGVWKALRDLEVRRLISTTRADVGEQVECHHDRIRESVCQTLPLEQARALHRALAEALELAPIKDSDALLEHWRGAGERTKASAYALRGAQTAENALAFKRAADLYREALALAPEADPRSRELRERLGHALILAGRGAEAAEVFLALIPETTPAQALTYRMLATAQLLRAGKLAEGFAELERADDLFGVRFPRSEAVAITMLLTRKARIAWGERRLRLNERDGDDERGARLEALWEVAAAVSIADFLRGSVYGAELMLRAMELGDPSHVAGGCGLEAVAAAAANKTERVQHMIDLAEEAGRRSGRLHLIGRVRGMQAICRQLEGRWLESIQLARESQELQLRSARQNWDHAIMVWWEMASASQAGQLAEIVVKIPEALRDAEARGDVYAATSFRTHRSSWAWLGVDLPEVADRHVETAEREWMPSGYQFQHWHMTYARTEVDLYRGTPARSLARVSRDWSRGRLVRQVEAVRSDMLHTRGRLCLASAREHARPALLGQARKDARALLKQARPWTQALGYLIVAGAASFEDRSEAVRLFAEAERYCTAADMQMHAAAARFRSAQLQGGAAGDEVASTSLETMRQLGVLRPERFADLLAPLR
jgi:hypothetical protein